MDIPLVDISGLVAGTQQRHEVAARIGQACRECGFFYVVGHRLSFAFFFEPNFSAEVKPIKVGAKVKDNKEERWDRASVHEFRGTYGDYLLSKVSKVFPELRRQVL